MKKKLSKGMGWKPDLPDHRDKKYRIPAKFIGKMPSSIDLRDVSQFSAVEDQGKLGSCTANAIVGALEYIKLKQGEIEDVNLSRLFIYFNERVLENSVEEDSGAYIRDGIKTVNKKGVCSETSWPYITSKFTDEPPASCYTEAKKNKSVSYQRLYTLDQMKACLVSGYPFVFGFSAYESFMSDKVKTTGTVPLPLQSESLLGGHAVLCIGYNNLTQRFLCRNSWGTDWGNSGYFTMPYKYLSNRDLSDDFWTIRA